MWLAKLLDLEKRVKHRKPTATLAAAEEQLQTTFMTKYTRKKRLAEVNLCAEKLLLACCLFGLGTHAVNCYKNVHLASIQRTPTAVPSKCLLQSVATPTIMAAPKQQKWSQTIT